MESPEDFSEDECVARSYTAKGSSRRKRHISWTTEEVVKLVDGVSQCGVGRWTEIKRLLFSSSSHRTSVDLKVVDNVFSSLTVTVNFLMPKFDDS